MRKKQKKMTKMMPKIIVLLVIIALIISIIKLNSTKASTDIVEITNVEIATKSDTTFVDSVKFEDGKIKSNVEFHKVGDYLTYNVTITNKEDKTLVLKSITDNNGNENLAYSYSGYEGAKLEANKAAMFNITITYAKEVDLDKREQNNLVQLTLTFEDEEGNEQEQEVIVDPDGEKEENNITPSKEETPKTGDKVGIYVAIAIVAVLVFIIITRRQVLVNKKTRKRNGHGKHGKKILGLILAIALVVPAFTNISKAATTSTLNTTIDTSIKFMDKLVVTYEVNSEKKNKVVGFNEALGELGEPTKEGYEFKGWQLEDGTPVTAETKVIKDITLTPIFEELAKTSEITINVEDENKRDIVKYVTLTAVNTNIEDDKVQLQYSLDNGDTWTDYNAEIAVEKNGTIKARAIVKDDNSVIGETEKEITTVIEDVATFKPGKEVNYTMMKLAGAGDITLTELSIPLLERPVEFSIYMDENGGEYFEEQTQAILKATSEQYEAVKGTLTEANIVSTEDSLKPIYMWYENNTIYYYTEAEAMLLNEDASYMFSYFMAVSQFDVSNFYTNKTKDMSFIFDYLCSLQELDLSSFDTRNVTNMKGMFFCDIYLRQLDLGKFNTSNVTDMSLMFLQCQSLQSLNVSNFDTSNVTSMDEMFVYCASLQGLDISNFDTSNVTDMYGMFTYCVSLNELDVSNFDTSKVTNMWGMFAVCQNLETIYASENFKTENVEDSENMFVNSLNVIGGNGTVYTEEHTDKEYAVIDKPETPGYFTDVINYLKCIIKLDGQVVGKKVELLKNDSKLLTVESTEDVDVTAEDNNVITLDDNGKLDVVGSGTAKITFTGKETGKTKVLTIIVKKVFTVTYDKNGEDATGTMDQYTHTVTEGETAYIKYNEFSRPGYTFNGWNTKADGSGTSYSEGQSVTMFADADDDGKVTLYAQWTGNTYTVYFQNNGGSGSMSNQTMTYGTPTNLIANTFTRNGYVFDGWKNYNEPEKIYVDGEEVLNLTTTDNGTVYLYAQWKQPSYTVVFDKNAEDATGTMENQTILIGQSAYLTNNGFTRTGYTFNGWNTKADGSGQGYIDKQSVRNLAEEDGETVVLYAQWERLIRYTTTLNGTEFESDWKIFHKEGDYVYLILADYLPNNRVNIPGINRNNTYDVYINWINYRDNYRQVFIDAMTNENNWKSLLSGRIGNHTFDLRESTDENITAMGSPSLELFVKSWNAKHPTEQLYIAETEEPMEDYLYGYYIGKEENPTSSSVSITNAERLYMPHPGWNKCSGYWLSTPHTYDRGYVYYMSRDRELRGDYIASWGSSGECFRPVICLPARILDYTTDQYYTIEYDKNAEDAVGTMESHILTYDIPAALLQNSFTREGYVFKGWNTAVDGSGISFTDKQVVSKLSEENEATVTLYAQWERLNVYTIHYNKNGDDVDGMMQNQRIYVGFTTKLRDNTFTREGYKFIGWNTEADGTGIPYNDGVAVLDLATVDETVLELYAQWRKVIVYKTSINGEEYESQWQVFHKEEGYVYLILDDYLPNDKVNIEGLNAYDTHAVYSRLDRSDFIDALKDETYWNSLLAGTIGNNTFDYRESTDEKIMAMGGPTLELFVASWNEHHPEEMIYILQREEAMEDGLRPYYIGDTDPASQSSVKLTKSDLLYFPSFYLDQRDCYGYWILSPSFSAYSSYQNGYVPGVMCCDDIYNAVYGRSAVYGCSTHNITQACGLRPVICLPESVIADVETDVPEYTVIFNKNAKEATGFMINQSIPIGISTRLKMNTFKRTGYTFKEWNTEEDGSGDSYTDWQTVLNLAEEEGATITLYAQWKPNKYSIVFDGNGGTGTMEGHEAIVYDEAVELNQNQYQKTGYHFTYWNTKADGSGDAYANKEAVSKLTGEDGGVVTLYAQWSRIGYSVKYGVVVNDVNLTGWKILLEEDGYTYLFYNGYLTRKMIPQKTGITYDDTTQSQYGVSQGSQELFVKKLLNTELWDELISDKLKTAAEEINSESTATGGATKYQIENSWKKSYAPADGKMAEGTMLNKTKGYNDSLYFPYHYKVGNSNGYYLASPNNSYTDSVLSIQYGGEYGWRHSKDTLKSIRPVIKVPTSLIEYKDGKYTLEAYSEILSLITISVTNEQEQETSKTVKITAVNNNIESNQVKLQYSLDNGTTWNDYTGDITITENGTIKARSVVIESGEVIGEAEKEITTIVQPTASSEITITVQNELQLAESKEVTLSAINTDIENNEVKLQYSLDNGNTWNDYTETIIVTYNGIIKARSVIIANGLVIGEAEKNITTVIEDTSSKFKSGKDVNTAIMKLAGAQGEMSWMTADLEVIQQDIDSMDSTITLEAPSKNGEVYYDETITEIGKATAEQYNAVKNSLTVDNIVSTSTSEKPVYVWIDNNKVYFYSEADKIYLNEDASYMFGYFGAMEKIDLTGIDTSKTINMKGLFAFDNELRTMNISSMDTRNVTNMSFMFSGPSVASLDLSGFNTSKVTDMSFMFGDPYLADLNLSSFDTRNVTHMVAMFNECNSLTELDISSFDTRNVTHMGGMFIGMMQLEKIYVGDKFVTSNVVNSTNMFTLYTYTGQHPLRGGNGTAYSTAHIDKEYARIDKPETPGYFTDIADKP